jgi:hypothetical protein
VLQQASHLQYVLHFIYDYLCQYCQTVFLWPILHYQCNDLCIFTLIFLSKTNNDLDVFEKLFSLHPSSFITILYALFMVYLPFLSKTNGDLGVHQNFSMHSQISYICADIPKCKSLLGHNHPWAACFCVVVVYDSTEAHWCAGTWDNTYSIALTEVH